jgi:NTP pyrophosphatase (non-canonical NTP hydrolase)
MSFWGWVTGAERRKRKRHLEGAAFAELKRQLVMASSDTEQMARTIERLERQRTLQFARIADLERPVDGDLPGLTQAEIERLAILAEECGEVVQAVGKVLRHGWESQSPYGGKPNRVSLERELGNVRAIVNLMLDSGDVRLGEVQTWQRAKKLGLGKWTHHQADSMPRGEQMAMMYAIEAEQRGMER